MVDRVANLVYKRKDYWDERFQEEESYEWLASFKDVESLLKKHAPDIFLKEGCSVEQQLQPRVLLVGCGNSSFSHELFVAGACNSISIDYSDVVIDKMKQKHPQMEWAVMDMTAMKEFKDATFDYIIDKAAMDALVTDEGDPWNPSDTALKSTSSMVKEVVRTLKPGGKFLQISFQQPHFRTMYLNHEEFTEAPSVDSINVGLGYFFYMLRKRLNSEVKARVAGLRKRTRTEDVFAF